MPKWIKVFLGVRQPLMKKWRVTLAVLSVITLVGGYNYLAYRQHQKITNDTTIPTWSQMAKGFVKTLEYDDMERGRWLVMDSMATFQRYFIGLFVGVTIAVALGVFMGSFSIFEAYFGIQVSLAATLPPTAAIAIFFVICGMQLGMYVAMIAFGVAATLTRIIYQAASEVPEELILKARTLGASDIELIWYVIVRWVLPRILNGILTVIGPAMIFLIAAEMSVGSIGFGYRIKLEMKKANMDIVNPYLALLMFFLGLCGWVLVLVRKKKCPWYTKEN